MITGTIEIKGERFVIVPESDYERMQEMTRDLTAGDGPRLPEPDSKGNVPAVDYARTSLARKLIRDRRRAGLTQAGLARLAGIRAETLCRIEKGKSTPDTATFNKIHRALEKAERQLPADAGPHS